jgi:glutamine synthetase
METLQGKHTKKVKSPKEVIEMAKEAGIQVIDYKFMDLPGTLQHISYHVDTLKESVFEDGIGFDGSSIRGFQAINESDMLLMPDPETAVIDPCCKTPTLSMFCNIEDPINRKPYKPRSTLYRSKSRRISH